MKTHHAVAGDELPLKSRIPANAQQILSSRGKGLTTLLQKIEEIIAGFLADGENPCTTLTRRIPHIDWSIHIFDIDLEDTDDTVANREFIGHLKDIIDGSDYFWSYMTDDGELCVVSADIIGSTPKFRFYADEERHFVSDYCEAEEIEDDTEGEPEYQIDALAEFAGSPPISDDLPENDECEEPSFFAQTIITLIESVYMDERSILLLTPDEEALGTPKTTD